MISLIKKVRDIMNFFSFVYELFKLLYTHFSFPIVILIFILLFKKDIHNLFQNIKSFSIGDYSIEVDVSEKIKATYDSISSISVEKYGSEILNEPTSLGGAGGPKKDTVDEFKIIHLKSYTINYYLENGWLDTVTTLYWAYSRRVEWDKKMIENKERPLSEKRDLHIEKEMGKEIKRLYDLAIQNPDIKWSYEDVMTFRKLIMIAVKPMFFS